MTRKYPDFPLELPRALEFVALPRKLARSPHNATKSNPRARLSQREACRWDAPTLGRYPRRRGLSHAPLGSARMTESIIAKTLTAVYAPGPAARCLFLALAGDGPLPTGGSPFRRARRADAKSITKHSTGRCFRCLNALISWIGQLGSSCVLSNKHEQHCFLAARDPGVSPNSSFMTIAPH